MSRAHKANAIATGAACLGLLATALGPSPALAQEKSADNGGYSIFNGTIADMTSPELDAAIKKGAVALWGLGVIEEHGPHLPLGTDIYGPYSVTTGAQRVLAQRGTPAVVIPVYYWGVNHITGAFPGSIDIRPEVMVEVMTDVFKSLKRYGVESIFCVTGHNEGAHNRAIYDGVVRGAAASGIKAYFVTNAAMVARLGLDPKDPHIRLTEARPGRDQQASTQIDVHAGAGETSAMWGLFPNVVRTGIIPTLPPTNLTNDDLNEWRKGQEHAQAVTPRGYFGAPAQADPARGRAQAEQSAVALADVVAATLKPPAK